MKKMSNFLKEEWVAILLILAGFIISIYFYPSLPDKMPVHWNIHGKVNGYGPKLIGAFNMPLISICIYLVLSVLPNIDPKRKNYESFKSTYQLFKYAVITLLLCVHTMTLLNASGVNVNISVFTHVAVSLMFILMGNVLGRVKHNYFVGIRTPWTLANEEVWKKTHRMLAPLFVAGGMLNLILALLGAGFYGLIVIVVVIVVVPVVYSYIIYQRLAGNK